MNRVDAFRFRQRNDSRDIQVRLHWTFPRAYLVGLVGLEAVQAQAIFLRVDAHGAKSELVRRAKDANGDFAAVGGQQFLDVFRLRHRRREP